MAVRARQCEARAAHLITADVVRRPLVQERVVGGRRHECACDNGLAITGHVRESALLRELEEHLSVRIDDDRLRALFRHGRKATRAASS